MKNLFAITLITGLSLSISTQASDNVGLFLKNDSLESRVCLTAATEGLSAATVVANESGKSFKRFTRHLKCNGHTVNAFANLYSKATVVEIHNFSNVSKKKNVVLVAKNNTESKVCADAVAVGLQRAAENYGLNAREVNSIVCNNAPISKFVNDFKTKNVQVGAE